MVHLGCWSSDVWVCKPSIPCSSTRCNLHFQWALGLLMQSLCTPPDLCTLCSSSLVKAQERLTELFIHFLLNFLHLPAFPVLTQPLSLWGRKKTQRVSLQYWFECSGKQESWVISPKLTFVCQAEMTCKRWVTSGDRKSVVTCSELSRLQFSSSVYKTLIIRLVNTSVYISLTLELRDSSWEQVFKTNTPLLWRFHF